MFRIAVIATLTLLAGGAAAQSPLTLEDIAALKQVTTVRMNPAGDRIAYLLRIQRELYVEDDGRPYRELHVVDLDGDSVPFVTGKIDITDIA